MAVATPIGSIGAIAFILRERAPCASRLATERNHLNPACGEKEVRDRALVAIRFYPGARTPWVVRRGVLVSGHYREIDAHDRDDRCLRI